MKEFSGLALVCTVLAVAGCASDTTLPPFHTSIKYDSSRSHTFLSQVPPTNAPSTRDWKTNQVVGVGYGTSESESAVPNATGTAAGAASSPSGISSGTAAGVSSGGGGVSTGVGVGPAPGSGVPGSIVGNPPGTGIIGGTATPAPVPNSAVNGGLGIGSPSTSTGLTTPGLNSTTFRPGTLSSPTLGGIGATNRSSGVLFTNTITGQTNFLPGTGLNRPGP